MATSYCQQILYISSLQWKQHIRYVIWNDSLVKYSKKMFNQLTVYAISYE